MHLLDGEIILSASDLTGFLACEHLTQLEMKAVRGLVERPVRDDPELDVLTRRGEEHELTHLARLKTQVGKVAEIRTTDRWTRADLETAQADTIAAMRAGAEVIYQATFFDGKWRGHADFLLRVDTPSDLGPWSYEVADTKLARRVRTAALLQMSNYSEHLRGLQGIWPERMHVILGDGSTESFPVNDFAAYYRAVKARYEAAVAGPAQITYPDPVEHCGVCRWQDVCVARRREDDHLSLVAGMRRDNTRRLTAVGVGTVATLAQSDDGLVVEGIGDAVLQRLQQQARLQVQQRDTGQVTYELLPPEPGLGLSALPPPSPGDLFFDMEGDPFAADNGLEYLFGVVEVAGGPRFHAWWGHDEAGEKAAFEGFIDFAMERLRAHPDLHIYHYAAYEPNRLKSLMGRYATREEEVDRLLRGGVLVDLYQVVRQGVRVSQESYSVKKLEPLYNQTRQAAIADAGSSIVAYEEWLKTGDRAQLEAIERYNEEDCLSTWHLREWLEARRLEAETTYNRRLPRPEARSPDAGEKQVEVERETAALVAAITRDLPEDPEVRSPEQKARWLLAQLLGWHKREARSQWWDYFRRSELSDYDLVADAEAIGGLSFDQELGVVKKSTVYRYRFDPTQLHKIGIGDTPHDPRTIKPAGTVVAIDNLAGTVDLKRATASDVPHPGSLIPPAPIPSVEQQRAIARVARQVIDRGIDGDGPYRNIRDLLLLVRPRLHGGVSGAELAAPSEKPVAAARRLGSQLDSSYLAIQGPPGSGKTWTGARMILDLVRAGRRVGIAATSHKAICNLLEALCEFAAKEGMTLRSIQRAPEDQRCSAPIVKWAGDNSAIDRALEAGEVDVVAGTAWLFAREEMEAKFDTVFIDEAGQMSLADVVAVSTAARNLVLLGDPQQLAHPSQGTHPPGAGVSALEHILDGHPTIKPDVGVFLATTFRMHPDVCSYISEIAYEKRLFSDPSCALQALEDGAPLGGTGMRLVPVEHSGNRTVSYEEIAVVRDLVAGLIGRRWTDAEGKLRPLRAEDILVVAPYNAQVDRLATVLPPGCTAGTVDRFQGQEAPVVIYSLATSSPDNMPRQMEFLYSLNRLNVAMSRARGLSVLVCAPAIMRIRCRKPQQMRLANAFCRLVEVAERP